MGEKTNIAWCTSSWSPWIGCTEVSDGCTNCYARELDKRHKYGGATHWGPGVPRYRTKSWHQPVAWNKKAEANGERWTVFPSLCDPFDNEVPREWRMDFFKLIERTPRLTWLLLTKRIGNVHGMVPFYWLKDGNGFRPNVWLGASIVNQEEADRDLPKLCATPAAKRFVSYEPAIAQVQWRGEWFAPRFMDADGPKRRVDWMIIGGESDQGGKKARPFNIEWARNTIAQCKAAHVACFVKQIGSTTLGWCLGNRPTGECPELENIECQSYEASEQNKPCQPGYCACREDRAGADPAEWPTDLRVQEFPR